MAIEHAICEASEALTCVLVDATPGTADFYRKLHFTSATVTDYQRSVPRDCPALLLIFVFPTQEGYALRRRLGRGGSVSLAH